MAFHAWQVEEDDSFVPQSDTAIAALERKAGAAVMQDLGLRTYWANTCGKTKYPGVYHLYKKELEENLCALMRTRMAYRELEEFMVVLGYEAGDIRECFQELTGVDPVRMEYLRQEDVNQTPASIPWYNLGWGTSKKKGDGQCYFAVPSAGGLSVVYRQVDDMTRREVASFLTKNEALNYLEAFVKKVHRYDMPAAEQAESALEPVKEESTKPQYMAMADYLWGQRKKGLLDEGTAKKAVVDAVYSGTLTESEGKDLIDLYVTAAPPETQPAAPNAPGHEASPKESTDLDYRQDSGDVRNEVERSTPQEFFESVLPDRMDTVTPQHIKDVLGYVSHRGKDMTEFDIRLHSLEYMKHEAPKSLVETNPESGRPSGPPRATISVILEIQDRTLPKEHSRKYALSVFFVNPDGDIGTSDSVKGEDDIIYGFSEDGLRQYFSRDRMVRGQG